MLLDIMMPDMNGLKVLDKIKETFSSMEVIMVTALAENAVAIESIKRGAFKFITKPIDLKHLQFLIEFKILQKSVE